MTTIPRAQSEVYPHFPSSCSLARAPLLLLVLAAGLLLPARRAHAGCPDAAPCKILALHGGGGSADSMQAAVSGLAGSLGAGYAFVYASIGGPAQGETWWDDPDVP